MKIKIGTRGSQLALAQANAVKDFLIKKDPKFDYVIEVIKSDGDAWQGTKEASNKDKKKWTGVLEQALLKGDVDFIVHSGKDVPAEINLKTKLVPVLDRKSPFDVFIGKKNNGERIKFSSLKNGSLIGTASARRKTQLVNYNESFKVAPHRGNVPTRIKKLDESKDLSGIIIAEAGLVRLGYSKNEYEVLDEKIILPAVNQGIIVAQSLKDNKEIVDLLSLTVNEKNMVSFLTERYVVEKVNASCHSAISIFANVIDLRLELSVVVIGQISKRKISEKISGELKSWEKLAEKMCILLEKKNVNDLLSEEVCD